jgi:hypothetical protein
MYKCNKLYEPEFKDHQDFLGLSRLEIPFIYQGVSAYWRTGAVCTSLSPFCFRLFPFGLSPSFPIFAASI